MSVRILIGDCRERMKELPDASVDSVVCDLSAGKAGEYLVCADLILKGHVAFPSEQGLPYDVVAEIGGKLYRVQVKSTRAPRPVAQRKEHTPSYQFHIGSCGKGGRKQYGDSVDLFALVALDTRTIGYFPTDDIKRTMQFRIRSNEGQYFEERIAARNVEIRRLRSEGLTYKAIAEAVDCDRAIAFRVSNGIGLERAGGRYLDECTLEAALGGAA
jgi:hypothetical protein